MLSVRITHVALVGCRGLIFSFFIDSTPKVKYIKACAAAITTHVLTDTQLALYEMEQLDI